MNSVLQSVPNLIPPVLNWIDQRKAYANPIFALLLVINVFVMPSYRASAALEEPVQPTATTPQQVQDAVDAVEVGVGPEDAFLENPVPIRNWGKDQKHIYETLFDSPYDPDDAIYILDEEFIVSDENSWITGSTISGNAFDFFVEYAIEYQYALDSDFSVAEAAQLNAVDATILDVTGTMTTPTNTVNINATVFQATRSDGVRNRVLWVNSVAHDSFITSVQEFREIVFDAEIEADNPEPGEISDCQIAFEIADNNLVAAVLQARRDLDACRSRATRDLLAGLAACAGTGMVAGALASLAGPFGLITGIVTALGCGLGVTANHARNVLACSDSFNLDIANARADWRLARDNAKAQYGEENCPEDPV